LPFGTSSPNGTLACHTICDNAGAADHTVAPGGEDPRWSAACRPGVTTSPESTTSSDVFDRVHVIAIVAKRKPAPPERTSSEC
jgi:hypothetical protein